MNCAIHTQTPAAAFCRTCGKALCENCKRDVMGAIYCEPCIAVRLQGTGVTPVAVVQGTPSPGVAAWLGMIPGVGAMYNGQFIKAFIHVVIFALLIAVHSYVHSGGAHAFASLLLTFFWFYMIFEAYKTAKARQMGLPAPDPLGLDRMFGIHEEQPPLASTAIHGEPVQAAATPAPLAHAPTGAVVLVALGLFFLLENFGLLRVGKMWPLFLIGFGLWIAYKRTAQRT